MKTHKASAELRQITGKKVRKLRRDGILPGNVYGSKVKSVSIQLNQSDFAKLYKEAGETGLIELSIGKETKPVLVHNLQLDPVSDMPVHVDFLQVDLKQKVTTKIPVEVIGESPAEKQGLGTVVRQISEIEVEALPADLPEKFTVDASNLSEVDQTVFVKDLDFDKSKVELKTDLDAIVVKVEPPQKVEEAPAPAAVEGEVPAEGEAATPETATEPQGAEPTKTDSEPSEKK